MTTGPPPREREAQIRALFARVAGEVEPRPDGLDRIRARIAARRPWWRRFDPRRKRRRPGT